EFDAEKIQTVLAPPQAGAIRSVRPVRSGNDTLLRIFSQPDAVLTADVQGGAIVVQARSLAESPREAEFGRDVRAQAATDGENGDAAGATTEVAATGDDGDAEILSLLDEEPKYTGRLISLDLQDTDIDNALRIIAEVSNLNIIASDD